MGERPDELRRDPLGDSRRETDPLPAALTGIGLGWLLVSTMRGGSERERYGERTYAYDYPATYDYPPRYEERTTDSPSADEALGRARDRAAETATQAQDRATEVAGRAQDRVSNLATGPGGPAEASSGCCRRIP
jgi:hypothetical protein